MRRLNSGPFTPELRNLMDSFTRKKILLVSQEEYSTTAEGHTIKHDIIGLVHSLKGKVVGPDCPWREITYVVYLGSYDSEPPFKLPMSFVLAKIIMTTYWVRASTQNKC